MGVKDLLQMLLERGNAMQTFWGFYITVAGALIAFFGSAQRSKLLAIVLTVAFLAFAAVNLNGMYSIAQQRNAIYQILSSYQPPLSDVGSPDKGSGSIKAKKDLLDASEPPKPAEVAMFHAFADLGVLVAIWLLTLFPRESVLTPKRPGS